MGAFKNYYEILGVDAFAEPETVKSAFRKLARQYHPDLNAGDPRAEEKFKEINEAYEVLGSPEKRAIHDGMLKTLKGLHPPAGKSHAKDGGKSSPAGKPPGETKDAAKPNGRKSTESAQSAASDGSTGSGGIPIHDFFENFLKKGFGDFGAKQAEAAQASFSGATEAKGKGPPAEKNVRGEDITLKTTITPQEAAEGTVKTVNVQHHEVCRRCSGTGKVHGEVCGGCHGERVTTRLKKMDIRIPPKVRTGSRVRVAGEGGRGQGKGENGDLFLEIDILLDPSLRIEGLNVHSEVAISMTDAALGTEIEVATLNGPVQMTVPPGTQTGKVFRLKERGVQNGGRKGDQFVSVVVVTPENLSSKEKELYRELAKLRPQRPARPS